MPTQMSTIRIDHRIMLLLTKEPLDFSRLHARMCEDARTVDRGLQRLRKAGKIRYLGGKGRLWQVV